MPIELKHVANPILYGAPANSRPRPVIDPTHLPLDPDDLPIAAAQTEQEQSLVEMLAHPDQSNAPDNTRDIPRADHTPLHALSRFLRRVS